MRLPFPLIFPLLLAAFFMGASVYGGAKNDFESQVNKLVSKGMEGKKFKGDILWVKRAAENFKDLFKLLKYSGKKDEFIVQTELLGRRSVADLIYFATDRLIELGEMKVPVCKGQQLALKKEKGASQGKAVVGKVTSLPCDKLKEIKSWRGLRETAANYCESGELKAVTDGLDKKLSRAPGSSQNELKLFCYNEEVVEVKNEFPHIFKE